jgi:predicted nuclease of predicted toxin-antitoxin system
MALRFFADHCVSQSIIQKLRGHGHEVFRLREHLPCDAPDEEVIAKAQELRSILISLNGDFSEIVNYPPSQFRGIIALQLRNHPEVIPAMMDRLVQYLVLKPDPSHYQGKLFLVEAHRIRIRQ